MIICMCFFVFVCLIVFIWDRLSDMLGRLCHCIYVCLCVCKVNDCPDRVYLHGFFDLPALLCPCMCRSVCAPCMFLLKISDCVYLRQVIWSNNSVLSFYVEEDLFVRQCVCVSVYDCLIVFTWDRLFDLPALFCLGCGGGSFDRRPPNIFVSAKVSWIDCYTRV